MATVVVILLYKFIFMRKVNVLVVSPMRISALSNLLSLNINPRLLPIYANTVEEAIAIFQQNDIEILAVDETMQQPSVTALQKIAHFQQPDTHFVSANLVQLAAGIHHAEQLLNAGNRGVQIIDDALKNAQFNITIN